jgi:hypothetical protein
VRPHDVVLSPEPVRGAVQAVAQLTRADADALSLAQGDVVRARGDGHDRAPHAAARDPRA